MSKFTASIFIDASSNINKTAKQIGDSFKNISTRATAANSSFADLQKSAAGVGKGFAIATAAVVGTGWAIFGFTKKMTDSGEALLNLSEKTGIGVKELQRLGHSATMADVSTEAFATSIRIFSKNVTEAGMGSEQAAQNFERIGVSVAGADGKMKSSRDLMLEVADRFSMIEDGAAKSALAQELFGRAGTDMIPMLNKGSAALIAEGDWLEKNSKLMDEDFVKASGAMNDQLDKLKASFSKVTVPLATMLIPKITELITGMTEFFANIEQKMPVIKAWATGIGIAAAAIVAFFAPIYIFNKAQAFLTMVKSLGALIKTVWAFNAATLASPFVWIPLAIVGIGVAIWQLVKRWDTVKAAVVSFGLAAWDVLKQVGQFIFDVLLFPLRQVLSLIAKVPKVGGFAKAALEGIDGMEAKIFGGENVIEQTAGEKYLTQLDVNMKIDQEGRARVTGAQASSDSLNFSAQMGLMIPQY